MLIEDEDFRGMLWQAALNFIEDWDDFGKCSYLRTNKLHSDLKFALGYFTALADLYFDQCGEMVDLDWLEWVCWKREILDRSGDVEP